ncbi:MAG: HAMP domain-containing sensor histidine kinase, partial [Bacteroidota bacterium]
MLHPPTSKKAHLAKESRTSHASSHIRRNLFFILTILLVILFSYVPEWLIYPDGDLPENWFLLRTATMSMVILIGAGLLLGVEALSKPSPPVKKANPQPEAEGEATMEEALGLQANQNTYIARVSHEIRNPMNTIMGFAEVLMNRELDPQSQAYARLIYRSSDDVIRLLSDIIDLNKVEEQKLSLERLSFDFKEVMASALLPFEYMAGKKDLLFETTFDEMPPFFWGDPHRIRQVLTNLVGNALKFTEEGKIKVHFHYQETAEGKPWIKTTISDTGIGIPTEKQKSVFQSFMQASDSTTRIYGGSGLGLNIVSQLVE